MNDRPLDHELVKVQNLGDAEFSYIEGPSPELDYVVRIVAADPRHSTEDVILAHNEYLWDAYWEPILDHAISVHYDYGFLAHIPEWARKRHAAQHAYEYGE